VGVIRKTEQAGPTRRRFGRSPTPAGWSQPEIPDWLPTVLSLGLLVLCPRPSAAADKVDAITFKNGDRVTCEVKTLERGALKISTDPLGTVNVHWGEVVAVASPREFEVQVSSGDRYFGVLQSAAPGQVIVSSPGTDITLALSDVIRLVPIGSTFWTRMDGSVDAGFSFAQANTETHLTTNASTDYRGRKYALGATYSSNITTRDDADRTFRSNFNLNASRLFDDRWFTLGWGVVEQNDELSLEQRLLGGGGFGRDIVHTNHRLWSIFSGLAYTHEQFTGEPSDQSLEAALGGELDFFTPMNNDFDFTNRIVSYFRLGGRSRMRLDFQTALMFKLFKDFYWSLNGFDTFDGDPPAEGKKNDFGISFTLGYKF
jgi:putative salt-induced outer membrane protein YdiY